MGKGRLRRERMGGEGREQRGGCGRRGVPSRSRRDGRWREEGGMGSWPSLSRRGEGMEASWERYRRTDEGGWEEMDPKATKRTSNTNTSGSTPGPRAPSRRGSLCVRCAAVLVNTPKTKNPPPSPHRFVNACSCRAPSLSSLRSDAAFCPGDIKRPCGGASFPSRLSSRCKSTMWSMVGVRAPPLAEKVIAFCIEDSAASERIQWAQRQLRPAACMPSRPPSVATTNPTILDARALSWDFLPTMARQYRTPPAPKRKRTRTRAQERELARM
jgi:hypothetical protein